MTPNDTSGFKPIYYAMPLIESYIGLLQMLQANSTRRLIIYIKKFWPKLDTKLIIIVKALKRWEQYLESYNHKVFILINCNNVFRFIDIKSLSSCHVCWAQELFKYCFWIDYCQEKAKKTADTLSSFSLQKNKEETNFWVENT